MADPLAKVGIIGCGNVSPVYLRAGTTFEALDVVACADIDMDKAVARAEEFGVRACTVQELLDDLAIDIIVNLTVPDAHAEVAMAAVEAGKCVYNEKPLTSTREQGQALLEAARARGVLVGGAPDTFFGGAFQTARKLIDGGAIGTPHATIAFMMGHGHETWHPNPAFYYKPGGGPMFDMGPYYLTALVNLLGPVRRVSGATGIGYPERTITSEPLAGQTIEVEVPTHVAGLMDFEGGAVGTIITSFDVWGAEVPQIQVFGTEGALTLPSPNGFGGPVRLWRPDTAEYREVPHTHGYLEQSRGIGVADMACALRSGRPHRASGALAYHVLDMMHAFHESSETGRHVDLASGCGRPAALPIGLEDGRLDA